MRKVIIALVLGLVMSIGQVFAQSATISGIVTDSTDGSPLEGMLIKAFIGKRGVAQAYTDFKGEYTLKVETSPVILDSVLAYRSGGYGSKSFRNVSIQKGDKLINLDFSMEIQGQVIEIIDIDCQGPSYPLPHAPKSRSNPNPAMGSLVDIIRD